MPTVFLDPDGRPLAVRGYVVPWNAWSEPLAALGGRRECFLPRSFDWWSARQQTDLRSGISIDMEHFAGANFTFVSPASAQVSAWVDDYGLAFEATEIAAAPRRLPFLDMIASGQKAACSIAGEWRHADYDPGAEGLVVEQVSVFSRFAITGEPAFAGTACWLSSQGAYDIRRPGAAALMASWAESRPCD